MIDCSHANTGSDYRLQEGVWNNVIAQVAAQPGPIVGLMVESNLYEGKQPLTADHTALRYGVSLTDGCIGWEQTERCCARLTARWRRAERGRYTPCLPNRSQRSSQSKRLSFVAKFFCYSILLCL
ncbi:MAG: hypothetical protein U0074_02450 [Kouleothrix sp.]